MHCGKYTVSSLVLKLDHVYTLYFISPQVTDLTLVSSCWKSHTLTRCWSPSAIFSRKSTPNQKERNATYWNPMVNISVKDHYFRLGPIVVKVVRADYVDLLHLCDLKHLGRHFSLFFDALVDLHSSSKFVIVWKVMIKARRSLCSSSQPDVFLWRLSWTPLLELAYCSSAFFAKGYCNNFKSSFMYASRRTWNCMEYQSPV